MEKKTYFNIMNAAADIFFIFYIVILFRFILSWMQEVPVSEINNGLELLNAAGWTAFIVSVLILILAILRIGSGFPAWRSVWNFIRAFLILGSVTAVNIIEKFLAGFVQINL